jgi:hypothetical protein
VGGVRRWGVDSGNDTANGSTPDASTEAAQREVRREPMRPWDLSWKVRLGLPATLGFAAQLWLVKTAGATWVEALIAAVLMAVVIVAWLRWRLPRKDIRDKARLAEVGRGGWANPTRGQRIADRLPGSKRRSSDRNPLAGRMGRKRRY